MSYFSLIQNSLLKPKNSVRAIASQLLRPKRLAIFEACLIGLVCGLAGVVLKTGVGWLGGWRVYTSLILPGWLILPSIGILGGLLTGFLIERFAPETAGSGIPHVKASLSGIPLALNGRVAVVKLIGTIIAVGSGLTLGRQGPTVQIGASLAAWISHWVPTSPEYRRQLIACGAAAGLAAGFNAPIAGVLFVVEELLQDISGLTLGPAIIASFIGAVVSQLLGGQSLNLNLAESNISFSAEEIPFYILLGIFAGLLGSLFTSGIVIALKLNRRYLKMGLPLRIALAGLICGLAVAVLPVSFRNNTGLRESLVTGDGNWQTSLIAFIAHFFLTIIAAGSGAPGGLFAPSLVLGSALGHLVGIMEVNLLGAGLASTYALAGMGAFFCAVCRAPITAVVIVFEITTDFKLVLPLMISSVVAYLVAEKAEKGSLYDQILEGSGIQLKKEKPDNDILNTVKAADVMQRRVETLSAQMTLDEAIVAFSRSHHRGFPVLNEGKLVGIITQRDLANVSERSLSGETLISEVMTTQPLTVFPEDTLSEVLYRLNRYNLSRLPVTEGRRLVGIITRSDIIRAESDRLTNEEAQMGPHPEKSYVVYQTRAPSTGQGRLLVPLANPQTAPALLELACAVAFQKNYELECVQVMLVSRRGSPAEMPVRTAKSRRLLQMAERAGRRWKVPVHTQIRVAHDMPQAILETIKERHIDLILMGWKGSTKTPGRIFGAAVDTLIRQASCDVVLVKWGKKVTEKDNLESPNCNAQSPTLNRWLVPMAGGPNAQRAVQLLPALVAVSRKPEIRLCQVQQPSIGQPDITVLEQASKFLGRRLNVPVIQMPICSSSVADALIDLAQKNQCDVVVLGASREGMLQQTIKGNIPEEIARSCNCTVMLVRSAAA
ncbi:chloride channel protein [Ancylothrix sp. C2]|uniref:chloride channel protein n=1 Tax=Ancylothrix sp. D3o TaxID=2953691 RepID=UPI0021BA4DC0|nr:chloride channel protein [Ancylothrix sp. D3o]MCT7951969.1 chloride channel protein [Ancylothrix sp. D3o]